MEGSKYRKRTHWHLLFSLFICVPVIVAGDKAVRANESEKEPSKTVSIKGISSGPYCGLNCLYTIMMLAGYNTDFAQLVKPKYIGSGQGSSLAELKAAAEDHGLYAQAASKLASRELCQSAYPIILHIKSEIRSESYNHYELFLGAENGSARLYDPPNPIRMVPFKELAPRWDGNGLILSAQPFDTSAVFAPSRKRLVLYAAAVVAAILALHWARRWLPTELLNTRIRLFGLSVTQAGAFAVVALLCGMLYHFANDEGLLANANATASIQQAHAGNFIPKISEKKVRKLLDTDAVLIDARFARDYEAAHLKGAISVPVDANDVERRRTTAHISKDAHIVLYCQSAACKFAETVAFKLSEDGFSNASIFRGGWAEWVAKNGKPKKAES